MATEKGQHTTAHAPSLTSPASTPTISDQALYALGQQSGELQGMNSRLDKIEGKLDGVDKELGYLGNDITRIDTTDHIIGVFFVIIVGGFVLPVAVEKWKRAFSKLRVE